MSVYLVDDARKVLRIVLKVDVINVYHKHFPLVFLEDKLVVSLVQVVQILQRDVSSIVFWSCKGEVMV